MPYVLQSQAHKVTMYKMTDKIINWSAVFTVHTLAFFKHHDGT